MTQSDYARKVEEVEALVNDPTRRLNADLVWSLLDEIARFHVAAEQDAA